MNIHSQKLVHHVIASHVGSYRTPVEDAKTYDELGLDALDVVLVVRQLEEVTGVDGNFFIDALENTRTVGELVALVDRWWQREAVPS
jgi:acyl carrier protein